MTQTFCQSCGMPLTDANKGTNHDGSVNDDFCTYCYKDGKFTQEFNMSQMIEFCAQFTDQMNETTGWNLTPEEAKQQMRRFFPQLKRWQQADNRSLPEKATALLNMCREVTIASINADGYPRPVPMTKIASEGYNVVWMTTSAESVKAADLKTNDKTGLCYSLYGDSVAMRGTAEVVSDDDTRKRMWQEWLINHFPGGVTDPDYVLIRFTGSETTFYIDGEFVHE